MLVSVYFLPDEVDKTLQIESVGSPSRYPFQILWGKVIFLSFIHAVAISSVTILQHCQYKTLFFQFVIYSMSGLGVTAGAHRLWAHRSYKAKLPLRILLAIFNCAAWQVPIYEWCRDHRTHHKCSETDGDPHNAKRGFFFSHIGWLMIKKHPDVVKNGKTLNLDDLNRDPVVTFQRKVFLPTSILLSIILPTLIPWYSWNENLNYSLLITILRYCYTLNIAFCVNSFAHFFGNRPYDKGINPAENIVVSIIAMGEGFHNYHHTFPQDYSTSEFGMRLNVTTLFIDLMAFFGLAYDRKKISPEMILARKQRTGKIF